MKRHISLFLVFVSFFCGLAAQTITITFEGTVNGTTTPLDSILVMNLAQGGDTTIYFPDNVLVLGATGIRDARATGVVMQSLPNPFAGRTEVVLFATSGSLRLSLHDAIGRELSTYTGEVAAGTHRFLVSCETPGAHVLTAVQGSARRAIRLMATEGAAVTGLVYNGGSYRAMPKDDRSLFSWGPGDELRYIGYATSGAVLHSAAIDEVPVSSITHTFVMAAGAVCPASPTVTDIDGNVYASVQIGDQCWMAENLRTSRYNDGWDITPVTDNTDWIQMNSGAWCNYDNNTDNDTTYGKLYNWYAANYFFNVCPQGWHAPNDAEWQQLEATLGMSASELGVEGFRGEAENVGGQLKTTSMWELPNSGATNASGFAGLPGGHRYVNNGNFLLEGTYGYWWTTTANIPGTAYFRSLYRSSPGVNRNIANKRTGCYVRCVRD